MRIEYLSPSQISTYMGCPYKYKLIYKDKIATKPKSYFTTGKILHRLIEKKLKNEPLNMNDIFSEDEVRADFTYFSDEEKNAVLDEIKSVMPAIESGEWIPANVEAAEKSMSFTLSGIPIYLIADIVAADRVVDTKIIGKNSLHRYEKPYPFQLILEAFAFGKDIGQYNLFVKGGNPIFTYREFRNIGMKVKRISEIIKNIYNSINHDIFPPVDKNSDNGWMCSEKWCDFYEICEFGSKEDPKNVYF